MFLRYKLLRVTAAVLAALFLLMVLTSCFGIQVQYAPSVQPPPALGTSATPSTTADPEVLRFAEMLGQVLSAAAARSDTLSNIPLDLLFRPSPMGNTATSDYTYAKLHMAEPGKPPATDVTISGETVWNAETGDASFTAYRQTGTESPLQAGVWFAGNTMLFKKGGDIKPRVQHTLTPQVAQSMRAVPAFDRLVRVLGDTNAIKLTEQGWAAAIGDYKKVIADNSRALDITSSAGTDKFGSVQIATVNETLKLLGARGVAVTRGLMALLTKDSELKGLFNTQYFPDGATYGVTGIDGALRDIDALDDAARNAAVLTVRLVETDLPVGLHLTLTAGGKTLALDLSFYNRGFISQNDILFGGFDGSRVVISQLLTTDGSGAFTSNFSYDVLSPGVKPQENITVITAGTSSGGALNETAQFSLTRSASPVAGPVMIGGTLTYAQKTEGAAAQGSGKGTLNISNNGVGHTYLYDMTLTQTSKAVQVKPPVYDPSSGQSTATQGGLYKALDTFDGNSFVLAPPTTRFQALFSLMFN